MTPLRCATDIVEFLKGELDFGESGQIYVGFLPKITSNNPESIRKRCPAIAVRPSDSDDGKDASTAHIVIYLLTYDEDLMFGSTSLYHLEDKIRMALLSNNPINNRYLIDLDEDRLSISTPDEQPYPFWWAYIEFNVNIPQPSNQRAINLITR